MSETLCTAVGIDVSKGKSTIAVMRPFGEIVIPPFEVVHTSDNLKELSETLRSIDGDLRIIMEYTGRYYQPIALYLYDSGFYVSVIHPKLIHDFANNSIRRVKTDKADAIRIANYGLSNWTTLSPYSREDELRLLLKTYNRQRNQYLKQLTAATNNLIALMNQTLPGINVFFTSPRRHDGHIKWIDVAARFWHCEYIKGFSQKRVVETYNNWCVKNGYRANSGKAEALYRLAANAIPSMPQNDYTKRVIRQTAQSVQNISESIMSLCREMGNIARQLPEYPVVISLSGVGDTLAPQLMAEIGDVRRFPKRSNLIAFAGVDAPPFQSGIYESHKRHISKRGSGDLRKALFLIVRGIYERSEINNPVYSFVAQKKSEGKPYYVCMIAGCNKFLRIYYARVKQYLNTLETV